MAETIHCARDDAKIVFLVICILVLPLAPLSYIVVLTRTVVGPSRPHDGGPTCVPCAMAAVVFVPAGTPVVSQSQSMANFMGNGIGCAVLGPIEYPTWRVIGKGANIRDAPASGSRCVSRRNDAVHPLSGWRRIIDPTIRRDINVKRNIVLCGPFPHSRNPRRIIRFWVRLSVDRITVVPKRVSDDFAIEIAVDDVSRTGQAVKDG